MDNTIQMNLFEYFIDEEKFSIQDATNIVKNIKNMQVNNESIRARIYEGVEKGIFTKISRGVYKVTSQIEGKENGSYVLLSKVEDDVIFEYHITVMDDEFNLGLLTMRTPEGVFETDFDK